MMLLMSAALMAQSVTVKGVVVADADEFPLPGVTVMIKGSTTGTITDLDGNFTLEASPSDVLEVSYVGFKTENATVGSKRAFNFSLKEDIAGLEELVVVGYGVQKKALVTGANANVKGDAIEKLQPPSAMEALQGTVPGLSITRNSGAPGAGTKVTIRGLGTIGNSSPLYIVDGVSVGDINYLAPSDIESIDVLKDAASAAIYGSRAANGVVLVTTKKGKKSNDTKINTTVSYDGYAGFQNNYKTLSPLGIQDYMAIQNESRMNNGDPAFDWENFIKTNTAMDSKFPGVSAQYGQEIWDKVANGWNGTNWVDEMTKKNAMVQSHSINLSGNSKDFNYAAGASYFNQEGIIGGDISGTDYTRVTARLNSELVLFKNKEHNILTFGENLTYTYNLQKGGLRGGNMYWNDFYTANSSSPFVMAYWDNPLVNEWTNGFGPDIYGGGGELSAGNPLSGMWRGAQNSFPNGGNTLVANVYGVLEPIKNLKIRSSFGMNSWWGSGRGYTPIYYMGFKSQNFVDGVNQNMYMGNSYTWTNTATYDFTVAQDHDFSVLIGNELLKGLLSDNLNGSRQNLNYVGNQYAYLDNTKNPEEVSQIGVGGRDWAAQGGGTMSYMGRISYNYKQRYMLDLVMRADGSSNFAPGKRWGYFPSVAAGWNFTEEDFMPKNDILSSGKLRASWGQNGNANVSNFVYQSNISTISYGYLFGNNKLVQSMAAVPANVPNEDISWERSEQLNIGLDLRLLDSRLGLTFDWYNKVTKDWLVYAPILGTFGAGAPAINGGDVQNQGYEIMLSWQDQVGDFSYGATFTGMHNENKVTRLANAEGIINGSSNVLGQGVSYITRVQEGYPIGFFYGYKTDGIFQNQEEVDKYVTADGTPIKIGSEPDTARKPGDVIFQDANGDGIVNDEDKTMIGSPHAKFEMGLQLNVGWKGIYANATLTGKFGGQIMQSQNIINNQKNNYTTQVFNRWHGEGTSNKMPSLSFKSCANTSYMSDIYMHDADYLRIGNVTLGYSFDELLKNQNVLEKASIYVSASNLFTFTQYDGMNPEVGYGSEDWSSGIDLGLYPLPRTVNIGVNLTF